MQKKMKGERYPVAFRPHVSESAGREGARCAVEKVDREQYYFKCREDAQRFMSIHGLEPVTDMTLERIRKDHPNAVVVGPLGGKSGTIVWDVYMNIVQVYPAVRAVYRSYPDGYPGDGALARQHLKVDVIYTVARVSIERSQTFVELVEKPGLRFRKLEFEYLVQP